ncbi:hypothetical protein AYK25_01605 [Thermoplasmatales archaeon SM1-50]|nr:MAG: hypothetical protein AYK25_01605 [Thermoplasmatales archaeon SM1-50]
MMKKHYIMIGIAGIIVAVIVIIAGVSGSFQPNTSADQSTITSTSPEPESLQTILSKAEAIGSMYYEIYATITMPQYGAQTMTMKIWQEKPYLKEEITGQMAGITNTLVVIVRPEGTYVYNPTQGKYVLTTEVPSYVTSLQYLDPKMIKDLLNNQTITDFETEIIDGKKTTIIEYDLPLIGENLMTIKIWIWNEKGVPLKAYFDMTMKEITMTMDFVFSNYSFSDIPDSTFNIT